MRQLRVEERDWRTVAGSHRSRMGRSSVDVTCPFCGTDLTIYLWSFAGCGKRLCACGAAIHRDGVARKLVEQRP